MPEKNIPLLRKTIEYIESHPDELNMGTWWDNKNCDCYYSRIDLDASHSCEDFAVQNIGCGTTMCFAGTAVFLETGRLEGDISGRATKLLGLTYWEAREIFYRADINTPEELRAHIEGVIGERL